MSDADERPRRRSRATRVLLAALFGVGMKKKRRKGGAKAAAAKAGPAGEGKGEKPRKAPKPTRPGRTPEQIERAGRMWSRVRSGIATVLVLATVGGGGGWYWWNRAASVPDLVGMSRDEARRRLEDAGLDAGVVSEVYVGDEGQYATGTVVAHVPDHAARVAPRTPVALSVVAGPAWTAMPKVAGLTVGQAVALLESLEMTTAIVDPVSHVVPVEEYGHGMGFKVASSTVPPGQRTERGTMVMLEVDRKVADNERRFVFAHPAAVQEKGIESCYRECHRERECSHCHLRVLGGLELPEVVTALDFIRDEALTAAGLTGDAARPRFVRAADEGGKAYSVVLNADAPSPGPARRSAMLAATADLFRATLGLAGIEDLTVTWVEPGTGRVLMTVRMTSRTMWSVKWSGLQPDQLPQVADYFK
ncbi:MAG: PASTA domain-containing protein, partial [Actinobacteria bacterium]